MSCKRRIKRIHCKAFSFIEIMVVVVIIGLLAGAVAIKVSDYVDKAKINRARSDIATLVNAIESFYAENGRYPSNDQGLGVLPVKKTIDPWGRSYQYNQPGRNEPYEIISYGSDGREGGEDADRDVTSESLE